MGGDSAAILVSEPTLTPYASSCGVGTHKFPQESKELFANFVSKKDHGDRFWDRESVLLVDFLERCSTRNSERYCETLKMLRKAIQNKRRGKMGSNVLFFHDNSRPPSHGQSHSRALRSFWMVGV